jgi:hypothetical protein
MSPEPSLTVFGGDLTLDDLTGLAEKWITPELAKSAGLRRVDSTTGREVRRMAIWPAASSRIYCPVLAGCLCRVGLGFRPSKKERL